MDEQEKRIRRKLRDDFPHYATKCLKIRSKSGEIFPFKLNKAQEYIHDRVEQQRRESGKVRAIILKGRQQGCSTYIEGRFYWIVTHHFGLRAFILTHDNDATNNLFEMAQRYHEHCPLVVRPTIEASNAKELIFAGLDSGYKLGTAGNKSVGRSSTIQLLHGSEVGFWPNTSEHSKGIFQAVPEEKGTEIFIESTANGQGNYFHQQWRKAERGESDFIPIFVPWYWQDEYVRPVPKDFEITPEETDLINLYGLSLENLCWRRAKISGLNEKGFEGINSFKQEYPMNAVEAFQLTGQDSFISPIMVEKARKNVVEKEGRLLIGVDPAGFGKDRTAIIRRKGRYAYGLETHRKIDGMEVVGIIHLIIEKEDPYLVFIDTIGMGGPMYDRLVELGHKKKLVAVNSAKTALNQKRFSNKRAEMWGLMRDWIYEQDCQIPDDDDLHADLCAPKVKEPDSNGRLKIEGKRDMLARHVSSPDNADALAHTFAWPDRAFLEDRERNDDEIAKNIMGGFNRIDRLKKAAYS